MGSWYIDINRVSNIYKYRYEHLCLMSGQGHPRSRGQERSNLYFRPLCDSMHVYGSDFHNEHEKWHDNTFFQTEIGQKLKFLELKSDKNWKISQKFLVVYFYNFQNFEKFKISRCSLIARIILSRLAKTDRLYLQTCMCHGVSRKPLFLAWIDKTWRHSDVISSHPIILTMFSFWHHA